MTGPGAGGDPTSHTEGPSEPAPGVHVDPGDMGGTVALRSHPAQPPRFSGGEGEARAGNAARFTPRGKFLEASPAPRPLACPAGRSSDPALRFLVSGSEMFGTSQRSLSPPFVGGGVWTCFLARARARWFAVWTGHAASVWGAGTAVARRPRHRRWLGPSKRPLEAGAMGSGPGPAPPSGVCRLRWRVALPSPGG